MITKLLLDKLFINIHRIKKLNKINSCLISIHKAQIKLPSKDILYSLELRKSSNLKLSLKINTKISYRKLTLLILNFNNSNSNFSQNLINMIDLIRILVIKKIKSIIKSMHYGLVTKKCQKNVLKWSF
jgi:hypothetical protein